MRRQPTVASDARQNDPVSSLSGKNALNLKVCKRSGNYSDSLVGGRAVGHRPSFLGKKTKNGPGRACTVSPRTRNTLPSPLHNVPKGPAPQTGLHCRLVQQTKKKEEIPSHEKQASKYPRPCSTKTGNKVNEGVTEKEGQPPPSGMRACCHRMN